MPEEEDRPASPAAIKLLMESGTPQVGPARFDGVRASVFGALFPVRRDRYDVVAPKTRAPDPEHGIR